MEVIHKCLIRKIKLKLKKKKVKLKKSYKFKKQKINIFQTIKMPLQLLKMNKMDIL